MSVILDQMLHDNKKIKQKLLREQGEILQADLKYQYSVYNSDPNFDLNDELTIDEILEILYVNDLQNIFRHFQPGMPVPTNKLSN